MEDDPYLARIAQELTATMASNTRTPLLDIQVTVRAFDLERVVGRYGAMQQALAEIKAPVARFFDLVEPEPVDPSLGQST